MTEATRPAGAAHGPVDAAGSGPADARPTEAQLARLVARFYDRARADPLLAPVLEAAIRDWDAHHAVVQGFWSHMLLRTQRYRGSAYAPHLNRGIRPEHFPRWLALFREAAEETLPPAAARQAFAHAEFMSQSYQAGLFPMPGD
jgi:hemoglobin